MKDDKERNYFSRRTMFWKASFSFWNAREKCTTNSGLFNGKRFTKKALHWIVATNALARFHIVTHCYATSFSKKKSKVNMRSRKYEVTLNSFANFPYVSSFFPFKRFYMETRLSNILKTTRPRLSRLFYRAFIKLY